MNITTEGLNISEVEQLTKFLCDLHQIDYNINIESVKNSTQFKITLKEN